MVFALSRPGQLRNGLVKSPCEDYSLYKQTESCAVLAIADGHGDKTCTRARFGALFACETAVDILSEFARNTENRTLSDNLAGSFESLFAEVKKTIVNTWRERCLNDFQLSFPGRRKNAEEAISLYGATLICVVITERYALLLQQGDGRAFVVHGNGKTDMPVPWDHLCEDNRTTSMCDNDAAERFRHHLIDLTLDPVLAINIESDGLEDSFSSLDQNAAWLN